MTGEKFHTASAYLTFVALDSFGRATPIPQITPTTPEEIERAEAAKARRKGRLELRERLIERKKGQS
jgi:acyl-CoA hydrolase